MGATLFLWVLGEVQLGEHALMEDADDQRLAAGVTAEEHDVLALLDAQIFRAR